MKTTTLFLLLALSNLTTALAQTAPVRSLAELCRRDLPQRPEVCASVADLEKEKLFQEISWIMDEEGGKLTSKAALGQLESTLSKGKIVRSRYLGGGISETNLVEFEDGVKAVFKPAKGEMTVTHEVATYQLDKLLRLNLVPMTVWRTIEGQEGSLQYFVNNAKTGMDAKVAERELIRLFDVLISNFDRHRGNYLVTSTQVSQHRRGRFDQIAIDHDQAFALEDLPFDFKVDQDNLLFYRKLKAVPAQAIRKTLQGHLGPDRIGQVLKNKKRVLKEICSRHQEKLRCWD